MIMLIKLAYQIINISLKKGPARWRLHQNQIGARTIERSFSSNGQV
jgi:hypothetical protein